MTSSFKDGLNLPDIADIRTPESGTHTVFSSPDGLKLKSSDGTISTVGSGVKTITAGTPNLEVNSEDPENPIISIVGDEPLEELQLKGSNNEGTSYEFFPNVAYTSGNGYEAATPAISGKLSPAAIGQETGCDRSPDGTKFWLATTSSSSGVVVVEYAFGIPFDHSTLTQTETHTLPGGWATTSAPYLLRLSSDGKKVYSSSNNYLYQWTLATAWDLSTAAYDGQSSVAFANTLYVYYASITFSDDGKTWWLMRYGQYAKVTLETAWDLTGSLAVEYVDCPQLSKYGVLKVILQEGGLKGVAICCQINALAEITLPAPYDLANATIGEKYSIPYGFQGTHRNAMLTPDGTRLSLPYYNMIGTLVMATPWDVTSSSIASVPEKFSVFPPPYKTGAFFVMPDGTAAYFLERTTNTWHRYNLATAYDASTAAYDSSYAVPSPVENMFVNVMSLSADGQWLSQGTGYLMRVYFLSTPFDLSTMSLHSSASFDGIFLTYRNGGKLSPDGMKYYLGGKDATGDCIVQFSLSTAWDVTTADRDNPFFLRMASATTFGVSGFAFSYDGSVLWLYRNSSDQPQWTLSTPWDISTATVTAATGYNYFVNGTPPVYNSTGSVALVANHNSINTYAFATVNAMPATNSASFSLPGRAPMPIAAIHKSQPSQNISRTSIPGDQYIYVSFFERNHYTTTIRQYLAANAHSLYGATDTGKSWVMTGFDGGNAFGDIVSTRTSYDGTRFFMAFSTGYIQSCTLETPFDISTATEFKVWYYYGGDIAFAGMQTGYSLATEGLSMYVALAPTGPSYDTLTVLTFSLSTAWDVSTASSSPTATTTRLAPNFYRGTFPDGLNGGISSIPVFYSTTGGEIRYSNGSASYVVGAVSSDSSTDNYPVLCASIMWNGGEKWPEIITTAQSWSGSSGGGIYFRELANSRFSGTGSLNSRRVGIGESFEFSALAYSGSPSSTASPVSAPELAEFGITSQGKTVVNKDMGSSSLYAEGAYSGKFTRIDDSWYDLDLYNGQLGSGVESFPYFPAKTVQNVLMNQSTSINSFAIAGANFNDYSYLISFRFLPSTTSTAGLYFNPSVNASGATYRWQSNLDGTKTTGTSAAATLFTGIPTQSSTAPNAIHGRVWIRSASSSIATSGSMRMIRWDAQTFGISGSNEAVCTASGSVWTPWASGTTVIPFTVRFSGSNATTGLTGSIGCVVYQYNNNLAFNAS